ncbi:MAG: alpha/beta fold hydrolase [Prochlorotrichaceae cyanobacterium]
MTEKPTSFELTAQPAWVSLSSDFGLNYWRWPGQVPILLLHGLADHGLVWANLAQSLNDRNYDWVAPDLRGHGDSSKPDRGYRCPDFIADLKAFVDHLGWSQFHVISHSWSSKLATLWATEEPERFLSLTVVDPFFIGKMPSWVQITFPLLYKTLPFLKTLGPFSDRSQLENLAQGLKQYRGWSAHQQLVFETSIEAKADGSWGSKFVVPARNEVFAEITEIEGLTHPLQVPTLLITPEQGLNRFAWQLRPFYTYASALSVQTIPGNHWPFLVSPETFHHTIAEWLSSQDPQG